MKRLLLIVLPLLLIVGCSSPEPINYETTLIERDGIFYTKDTNKPYSGRVFSLYEDGKKKMEGTLEDGVMVFFKPKDKDKKIKTWTFYDKNDGEKYEGHLIEETEFQQLEKKTELPYFSLYSIYLEKPVIIMMKDDYVGGHINVKYDKSVEWNELRQVLNNTYFYENGMKKSEKSYRKGRQAGLEIEWYENGQKEREVTLKDGIEDGLLTSWYENGQKAYEVNYKDGKWDGLFTAWYENGEKEVEANYKDGIEDGLWISWYKNGQKKGEGTYKDGEEISKKEWNEDGSVQ